MTEVVIVSAARTPVGAFLGGLSSLPASKLGEVAIRAALERAGVKPEEVDEVILGNALGAGGNPARLVALAAGLPERVAGLSLDRQCCGGLDALRIGEGHGTGFLSKRAGSPYRIARYGVGSAALRAIAAAGLSRGSNIAAVSIRSSARRASW